MGLGGLFWGSGGLPAAVLTPVSHGHRLQQRRARGRTRAGRQRPRRPLDTCTSPHCSEPCSSLPPPPPPPSLLPTTSPFTEMPCLTATLVESRRAHLGKVPPAWWPPCPLCTSPQLVPCQHQHQRQVGTLVSFGKWGSVSFPIKIFLKKSMNQNRLSSLWGPQKKGNQPCSHRIHPPLRVRLQTLLGRGQHQHGAPPRTREQRSH